MKNITEMYEIIEFGKYKGCMIKDIPSDYILWYLKTNNNPISLSSIKNKFLNELIRRDNQNL